MCCLARVELITWRFREQRAEHLEKNFLNILINPNLESNEEPSCDQFLEL